MKNSFKIIFTILLVSAVSDSCTKLDETVYDQINAERFFRTDEEFLAAIGPAYTNLYPWMQNNNMFPAMEVPTDEIVVPKRSDGGWDDGGIWARLKQHKFEKTDDKIASTWSLLFAGVSTCNRLISTFEKSPSATAKTYISELIVLRALYYWWLLDMFGNVPIETRFADADPNPPTKPSAEVYAFIEKELLDNVGNLSKNTDITTYGRVNYYVGQMVLAKLYLNAGVYTGTTQWEKAAAACDNIISGGKYNLETDFFSNFIAQNEGSKENMFVIPYDQVNAQGFWMAQTSLNEQSGKTFASSISPWNGFSAMQEFYMSYSDPVNNPGPQGPVIGEDGNTVTGTMDIRLNGFLAGPQYEADGVTPLLNTSPEPEDPDGPPIVFTPKINSFTSALKQAGVRIAKWPYVRGVQMNMDNDFAIFRYADVLLMKAEALWRLNPADASALSLVNEVRERAGVDPYAALTEDNLLAERGREFFAEGHRRTDLIRFGRFNDAWEFKEASDPHYKVFPVPNDQLNANPNLQQNPGY